MRIDSSHDTPARPSEAAPAASTAVADVTVVVSTFNRARYLPEAIESLLAQTRRPARILVVDDGSTDDPREALARSGLLERVDFIRKDNGGKARALNLALESVATRYVWFFDDDDAAYPDALARLLATFEAAPGIAIAFGSFDIGRGETRLLDMKTTPAPYAFAHEPPAAQRLRLFRQSSFMMSGSLLLTDAVRTAGGLNPALIRSQDYDLMIRIATSRAFRYCGGSVYVLREHDGVRGSLQSQHSARDKVKVWTRFNAVIGHYLRYELPLSAYSPRPEERPDPDDLRDALIARAWALAPKLPLVAAVDDILEAFRLPCAQALHRSQLDRLSEVFNDDSVPPRPLASLLRLCRLALQPGGAPALQALSRGLYWAATPSQPFAARARAKAVALVMAAAGQAGRILGPTSRAA